MFMIAGEYYHPTGDHNHHPITATCGSTNGKTISFTFIQHKLHTIYCFQMSDIVDLASGLSSDYGKLYENGKYTDINIYIGKEPNSIIFLAHTVVLCARSPYFEKKLTENTDTGADEIQKTAL